MRKTIYVSLVVIFLFSIISLTVDKSLTHFYFDRAYGIDYNTDIQKEIDLLKYKTLIILSNHHEITDTKLYNMNRIIMAVYINSIRYEVDPELLLSMMYVESRMNYKCKSWAGAIGLMQIMPQHQSVSEAHIWNIETNIRLGAQEISQHIKNKKSIVKALYRYNGVYITQYDKTTRISKESYYYGIRVMDIYYEYKNLSINDKGE